MSSGASPGPALLRGVFEAAVDVARELADDPTGPEPPRELQPFLRFHHLPGPALTAARRVLDTDAEFRARVAESVDEADVGRAGWLFVTRPDGWSDEVDRLVAAATEPVLDRPLDVKRLDRRLAGAERAAERAERRAGELASRVEELEALLDAERRAVLEGRRRIDELAEQVTTLTGERRRAVRELKRVEGLLAERVAEVKALGEARARAVDPDVAELTTELEAARAQQERLTDELTRLRRSLGELTDRVEEVLAPERPPPRRGGRAPAGGGPMPVPVPAGLLDDSVDAARSVLTVPGIVVVVDGYNVTKSRWPDADPVDQRERLQQALADASAVTGARFEVVYDGTGAGGRPARVVPSMGVHVRFTPESVEADDVVMDLAAALAADHPVVGVSSDRRVRDGLTDRGVRCLASAQLLAALP